MSTPEVDTADALRIRTLERGDLDAVMEIEAVSFSTPWRRPTFEGLLLRGDTDLIAATREGRLVGYAICWTVVDQAELGNLAVAPDQRGHGTGRRLVEASLARVRRRGAREIFLEVRESNRGAQELYRGCGFEPIGRRKRYYAQPAEDAIVMRAEVL